jgi:hypothetical protein
MDSRESAFWVRLKANRWAYTFTILATLAVGILIGTCFLWSERQGGTEVVGRDPADHSRSATALERLLPDFQATGAERGQHQYRVDH